MASEVSETTDPSTEVAPRPPDITVYAEPIHIGATVAAIQEPEAGAQAAPQPSASVDVAAVDVTLDKADMAVNRLERSRKLGGVVSFLAADCHTLLHAFYDLDIGKLKPLLAGVNWVVSANQDRARTVSALRLLRVWTAISPGAQDDEFLGRIDHLLSDSPASAAALDALCGLVADLLLIVPPVIVTAPVVAPVCSDAHNWAFKSAGIDWPIVVALCQGLVSILKGLPVSEKSEP